MNPIVFIYFHILLKNQLGFHNRENKPSNNQNIVSRKITGTVKSDHIKPIKTTRHNYHKKDTGTACNPISNKSKIKSKHAIKCLEAPAIIETENKAPSTELQQIDNETLVANRLRRLNKRNHHFNGPIIAVLVLACDRITVKNCLDDLIRYRPNRFQFPIIVSQVSYTINILVKIIAFY